MDTIYNDGTNGPFIHDFVKISWHIFLKDFLSYAASFRES